ncbi:trypanothione synthetase-like protein [Leptomonas pyrrhocoris]|uniref:Trypanothione synthetase-like protein n=1 Tax=Leptomonas pyrrhocoris TaxID=157538 RepID=A0A0M9G3M2_LEPPY|nr:trypanothione synthetase-like protein [Leptomonas pyrrhocoris]KPA81479.1 trypanothione synthetase-like protein [Leptomonas pyrrhocoris]|eukprot:XP_015659918.1 trypanothione synthetase-like protein [Leptomonas pyrrhocoris]
MVDAVATPVSPAAQLLPYGEQQGSFRGVVACSNRDDGYFSGENNYVNSLIYTGYRYQCVEYARRFLLLTTGCIFGNCGRASEIYAMDHITDVETGEKYTLHHHCNDGTATRKPQPGDVIIYPYHPELTPWGHVGVISYVDDHRVGIAEQNQYFGPFFSPNESYLDGERCVARYATLLHNAETNTWTIEEEKTMPQSTGWLSYPDTPTREHIYAPFNPLPNIIRERSTAFDDPDHPHITHYHLHAGLDIPSGRVGHAYGMRSGAAETLVGATSATARVLRFTLQFFFHRSRLGQPFRSLPTNPLNAPLPEGADTETKMCRDLDALFKPFEADEMVNAVDSTPMVLLQALATYFDIPLELVQAMEREFSRGEIHLAASLSFYPNVATDPEDIVKFRTLHKDIPSVDSPEEFTSPSSPDNNAMTACNGPFVPTVPGAVEEIPIKNPHDEAWCLGKVNFGNARLLTEMAQIAAIADPLKQAIHLMTPSMRSFMSTQYRMDFGAYLKMVETQRGPRTAFTIVMCDVHPMDGLLRELVFIMQSLCERMKYPVRVVNEKDLTFEKGKLRFMPSDVSPPPSSPATSSTPIGPYEVNFVYALCEWPHLLDNNGANHAALYNAAVDPASDVVFAKPLWSYLCSGLINVNDVTELDVKPADPTLRPRSVRFYDIVRRLYLFASPKQPYESWDQEVSEFKDSCRRIHIDAPSVPLNPPGLLRGESAMLNFATSCFMGHVGGLMHEDEHNTGEFDGIPSCLSFMFPKD